MSANHTPGPWELRGDLIIGGKYIPENPKAPEGAFEIAKLTYTEGFYPWIPTGQTREANGRLIAAAPELLGALRECITEENSHCLQHQETPGAMARRLRAINDICRAALKKAIRDE
jgi:hypothetical protein